MPYPDSFMEWVVGAPIPKPKPRRVRSKSPMRRVVVHVETTDSEYASEGSYDDDRASQKKVHFDEKQKFRPVLKKTGRQDKASKESVNDAKSISSQGSKAVSDSGTEESASSTSQKSTQKEKDKGEEARCCSCHAFTHYPQENKGKDSKNPKKTPTKDKKSQGGTAQVCSGCAQKAKEDQQQLAQSPKYDSQLVHRNSFISSNHGFNLDGRGFLSSDQIKNAMDRYVQSRGGSVVIREDVVEGPNDPRPNAFYDSTSNTLRVYHGPSYGNSYATLVPNTIHYMPVGTAPPYGSHSGPSYSGHSAPYPPPMAGPYMPYPTNYYNYGQKGSPVPHHAYPVANNVWGTPQMRNNMCSPRMNPSNVQDSKFGSGLQNGNSNNNKGNNNQSNLGGNRGNSRNQNGGFSRNNNQSFNSNSNGNKKNNQSFNNQDSNRGNVESAWGATDNNNGGFSNEPSSWGADKSNDKNASAWGNDNNIDNSGDNSNDNNGDDNPWGASTEQAAWGDPSAAQSTGGQQW